MSFFEMPGPGIGMGAVPKTAFLSQKRHFFAFRHRQNGLASTFGTEFA
jgi:hypothetical protein